VLACYWWPGIRKWVANYVKGCTTCQQTKILTHRRKTPIYRIPTQPNTKPFQTIAMDLITGLPPKEGKDAILMIVDHRCSRAAIFIPCNTTITGPGIAQLYLEHIYRWFRLPAKIISDRDPQFTSHFGTALAKKLGIQWNLSTAFHPQTDGLSERKNQWVEQYLQTITSTHPEDWTKWIALASAVHNNRVNAMTGLSPNQIILGYNIPLEPWNEANTTNETIETRHKEIENFWNTAIEALNKKATTTPHSQFAVGDQVWLEASHL
jgi:hypothetical protein